MNDRRPDWKDLTVEGLADDVARADARILQLVIRGESFRMLARVALEQHAEQAKALKAKDATIAALREELRAQREDMARYTAAQVGQPRKAGAA